MYPTHFIKNNIAKNSKEITDLIIQQNFQSETQDIHIQHTKTLAYNVLLFENPLDATHTLEQAFRLKLLSNTLPTLSYIKQNFKSEINELCPQCKIQTETTEHLWTCPHTISKFPQLKTQFINNFQSKLSLHKHYFKWKFISTILPSYLLELLEMNNSKFLYTPQARGIVTYKLTDSFNVLRKLNLNSLHYLLFSLDCWFHAFYQIIW
jgi:hypothetical protein